MCCCRSNADADDGGETSVALQCPAQSSSADSNSNYNVNSNSNVSCADVEFNSFRFWRVEPATIDDTSAALELQQLTLSDDATDAKLSSVITSGDSYSAEQLGCGDTTQLMSDSIIHSSSLSCFVCHCCCSHASAMLVLALHTRVVNLYNAAFVNMLASVVLLSQTGPASVSATAAQARAYGLRLVWMNDKNWLLTFCRRSWL